MPGALSHPKHDARAAYHPGLDGLRAFSIIAVLLYHGGVAWAGGGFLGVEVFFVLSGFLITSLLVAEWRRRRTISLRSFWGRRARRLLPALLFVVAAIGVYYTQVSPDRAVPGLEGDGLATLAYVGNWHQIAAGSNYFVANGQVSPLEHTWSLAIEEQFYLVWPLLVLGILSLASRRARRGAPGGERGPLRTLLAVSLLGVLASAVDSALLLHGGQGIDRVYYGTDTRASGLLAGASLAIGLALADARRRPAAGARSRPAVLPALAVLAALIGVLAVMGAAAGSPLWLYPYGLLLVDASVLVLISVVVLAPATLASKPFELAPLRWIGTLSYGIYLWHFPLFLWLDDGSTGLSGAALLALRVTITLSVSVLSFYLIERPVRQRRIPAWLLRPLVPLATGATVATLLVAGAVEASGTLQLAAVPAQATVLPSLQGTSRPCPVRLADTAGYGLAPLSPTQAAKDEPAWLVGHRLKWGRSTTVAFRTCPPKRVMVIGDSLAFTLGVGLMEDEQAYGVEVADAAILGCAFNNHGQLDSRGKWESQYAGCPNALQTWAADERALRAQAVVIELGYRDEFDWKLGGGLVHLGEPGYDALVSQRLQRYIQVLGQDNTPILLLTVPWSDPPALPDGSPAPAASPARHAEINDLLRSAAAAHPGQVHVLDLDRLISPGNHYDAMLNGKLCRFDGVHFTVYCSRLMQPPVLKAVRSLIGN